MSVFERCLEKCRARKGAVVYSDGEDRRVLLRAVGNAQIVEKLGEIPVGLRLRFGHFPACPGSIDVHPLIGLRPHKRNRLKIRDFESLSIFFCKI